MSVRKFLSIRVSPGISITLQGSPHARSSWLTQNKLHVVYFFVCGLLSSCWHYCFIFWLWLIHFHLFVVLFYFILLFLVFWKAKEWEHEVGVWGVRVSLRHWRQGKAWSKYIVCFLIKNISWEGQQTWVDLRMQMYLNFSKWALFYLRGKISERAVFVTC